MQIELLGPLRVRTAHRDVAIPAAKQRVILASLALNAGHVVAVDDLIGHVWTGSERGSVGSLRTHMMRLRQTLGDAADVIRTVPAGYLLAVSRDDVDVHRFTDGCRRGVAAAMAGQWAAAASTLADALTLWHAEPLLDVPSPPLRDREVGQLCERRLTALRWRIEADLHLGRHDVVIAELEQLTALHPLRENFHHQLMRALYSAGRQADALAAYQHIRGVLVDELGVEPGPDLTTLHQDILAAAPALAVHHDVPAQPRGGSPSPAQLPPDIADFTGRDKQLAALRDLLTNENHGDGITIVVSAVTGAGGVGKTSLVVRAAHRIRPVFPDGQLYVDLRGAGDAPVPVDEVLGRFLRDLGLPGSSVPADPDERTALYRSMLADRRVLLVLDNAQDAGQVRRLLPAGPGNAVLVTSRNRMAGLESARHMPLDVLDDDEAREMFTRIVGADRLAAEPAAAGQVLAYCAGLPLALRIAGARLATDPGLTLRELAYTNLPDAAPDPAWAFRLLGLWRGADLSTPATAALLDSSERDARRALDLLVNVHLVQTPTPGRYRCHDLLQAYATELAGIEPAETRGAALGRLLRWYLHTANAAAWAMTPGRRHVLRKPGDAVFDSYDDALAWFRAEHHNLVTAVAVAAEHGFDELAWQLPTTLWELLNLGGYWDDWVRTHRIGLAAAKRVGDDEAAAWTTQNLGAGLIRAQRLDDALDVCRQAVRLRRESGNRKGYGTALFNLAAVYLLREQYRECVATLELALPVQQAFENTFGLGATLDGLGTAHFHLGEHVRAESYYERALAVFEKNGDTYNEAACRTNIGRLRRAQRQWTTAAEVLRDAVDRNIRVGHRHGEAEAREHLGLVNADLGNHTEAVAELTAAMAIFRELDEDAAARVATHLAELHDATPI